MDVHYELTVKKDLMTWEAEIMKQSGILERMSRGVQKKVDALIPQKVHNTLTKAMEVAVKSVLNGINLLPISNKKLNEAKHKSLVEIDRGVDAIINRYKKLAAAGGAGTGAGGILMMAIDYPTLISLKLKMLQEIAQEFGYNTKEPSERIFILKVFLLAFSGDLSRKGVYLEISDWETREKYNQDTSQQLMNWREFYTEYKESIEFKKLFQIVPGIGAIVGAWANYSLMEELGTTARNAYRIRYFKRDISYFEPI